MKDMNLLHIVLIYLAIINVATLEDFVWWSGMNISDCRKGIALSW